MLYTILLGGGVLSTGAAFLLGVWFGRRRCACASVVERPVGGQAPLSREELARWRQFLTYDGATDEEAFR